MKNLKFLVLAVLLLFSVKSQATLSPCTAHDGYTANGTTTIFTYSCRIFDKSHLEVIVIDIKGVATVKTLDTDYTVQSVGSDSGTITFTVAPANNERVVILRKQPVEQGSSYVIGEGFPSQRVMRDLDKLAAIAQMHNEALHRATKFSKQSSTKDIDFPEPSADKCVAWNSGATALANVACGTGAGGSGDSVSVNGVAVVDADLDDATPVAPANSVNVRWQKDASSPANISGYVEASSPLGISGGKITVTAAVPYDKGGTGQITAPDDRLLVGNGSGFDLKTLPDCDDTGGNHLNYDQTTNAFSCGTSGGGAGVSADVQIFITGGGPTWTKPASPKTTCVYLVGAGGGGGSGRRGAAGTLRGGGSAGGGGAFTERCWPSSILGATETVTVGAQGLGGIAQIANDTNGNNGTAGAATTFGAWAKAGGGGAGGGGIAGAAGSGSGGTGLFSGGGGGSTSAVSGAGGGGVGGSITSGDVENTGAAGGDGSGTHRATALTGGALGAACANASNGTGAATNETAGGGGGGGGGGCKTATAGNGGTGSNYGGGGGGGGGSLNGFNSGAGANGGNGIAVVVTYF